MGGFDKKTISLFAFFQFPFGFSPAGDVVGGAGDAGWAPLSIAGESNRGFDPNVRAILVSVGIPTRRTRSGMNDS